MRWVSRGARRVASGLGVHTAFARARRDSRRPSPLSPRSPLRLRPSPRPHSVCVWTPVSHCGARATRQPASRLAALPSVVDQPTHSAARAPRSPASARSALITPRRSETSVDIYRIGRTSHARSTPHHPTSHLSRDCVETHLPPPSPPSDSLLGPVPSRSRHHTVTNTLPVRMPNGTLR